MGEVCPVGTASRYSKPEAFKKQEKRVTKMPVKSDMGVLVWEERP